MRKKEQIMKKLTSMVRNLVLTVSIVMTQQSIAAIPDKQQQVTPTDQQTMILYYVNQYRIKHHLAPLKMMNVISQEAAIHSRDMASHAMSFGHDGFNGRIKRLYQKIKDCNGAAENVAYYKVDAKKLVEQWVASRGHRQNIEGNYNLTGIGIAYSKKGWAYYTQIFIRSNNKNYV